MNGNEILGWLRTAARWFCGATFLYASLDKLGAAEAFTHFVSGYAILPKDLVPLTAVVVPWLEFLTGIGLWVGFRWRGAVGVYCGLMSIYTLAIAVNLVLGIPTVCGCFSDAGEPATWLTVLRDLALLAPGLWVLTSSRTLAALDGLLEKIQK